MPGGYPTLPLYHSNRVTTGETVVQLSKGNIQRKTIQVEFPLDGLDASCLLNNATYKQIQDYV